MNEQPTSSYRGWTPGNDSFPGLEQTFSSPTEVITPTVLPAQPTTAAKSILPFNMSNLGDIKAIVDRMGGIDGVLTTMGKVQKFMSTMQQFAPMIKLFMSKGKSTASTSPPRRSRKRRSSGQRPVNRRRTTKKR